VGFCAIYKHFSGFGFFLPQAESTPAHTQLTQTVRHFYSIYTGDFTMSISLLLVLLAFNVILHGIIVARFGIRNNQPVFAFMLVYAALAIAVYLSVPNVLWAVLFFTTIGTIGLTVTFNKIARDKRLEMVILPLNIVIILVTGYLLFAA
jgi:hypothetical protein